jgi:hypothetical protein
MYGEKARPSDGGHLDNETHEKAYVGVLQFSIEPLAVPRVQLRCDNNENEKIHE